MVFFSRPNHCNATIWTASLFTVFTLAACRPAPTNTGTGGSSGTGGRTSTGGNSGTAGSTATGGSTGSGGDTAKGGTSGSGGTIGSGGNSATGGMAASGGNSAGAAGGTTIPDAAVDTAPPPPSRGPTPAKAGHAYPFPQNRENSRCIYPNLYRNEDVQAVYTQWKNDTVTTDGAKGFRRVKRPKEPGLEANSTVSEGIAYGMMLAVYMDDQTLFDDLWQYEQQFLDATGLMHWYIKADGSGVGSNPSGLGPATDADEDMAFALVMADKQWGGELKASKKKYIDIAKDQIKKVWSNEVYDYKYLKPWLATNLPAINISYFAPAFYKIFAKVDTENATNWKNLTDTMYEVLNKSLNSSSGNMSNGLVPAWCDANGVPNGGAFGPTGGASPTNYQYDSCRTPFRIGLDYCWFGDTRAKDYVAKNSGFFAGIGATKIVDGYALNGTPQPQYQKDANAQIQSAAFVGPAAIGAMSSSSYQTFVNDAYGVLITGKAVVGGTYYDESWMALSLLMLTANFLDFTAI